MEMPRLSKSVVSAVRLERDASGDLKPVVLYRKPQAKKKKGSAVIGTLDKGLMRLVRVQQAFLNTYTEKHDQSNAKKKDGWVLEMTPNLVDAGRAAQKKLKGLSPI
jgi:hypothetical protein